LVHSQQVSYTEVAGDNMNTDLSRLTNTTDGYLDEVHSLRKLYNADIVVLMESYSDNGGLGWILNNSVNGSYDYAFNVIRVEQSSWTTTSIHEMGHNLGMKHNKEDDSGSALYDYAYGWHWIGNDSQEYGSVMSYIGIGTPYFSNPANTDHGKPTGTATADNAQVFRNTKHVVAFYSDKLANIPSVPTNIVVSNPADNGATFSWDPSVNAVKYRVCFPTGGGYYSYAETTNTTFTISNSDLFPKQCTSYDFFIIAQNECGDLVSSPTLSFTTECTTTPITPPTVTTLAATDITQTSAILNKTVTAGTETITAQGFEYRIADGSAWSTSITGDLSDLTAGTTYQFYAYATTESGTVNGSTLTFTTQDTVITFPSGITGTLAWELCDSTLTFSGKGAMDNYTSETNVPWYEYRNTIDTIVLADGITSIGDWAFSNCTGLTSVINQATTPQSINSNVFENVNINAIPLTVPAASIELYKAANVWKDFIITALTAIEPIEAHNLNIFPNPAKDEIFIRSEQSIEKVAILDIAGRTVETRHATSLQNGVRKINVSHLPKGVYIVRIFMDGQIITKKIIKN
jgi:hypothetical protein